MNRLHALLMSGIIAIAAVLCGCDGARTSEESGDLNDRNTIEFTVDSPGVSYLYRDPQQGLHTADALEDIPLENRVAVIAATKEHAAPPFDARRFFVADLLGAKPGTEATATSLSKKTFVRRNLAASLGHGRAEHVRFWAQEVSQLDPTSERARSSDRALRLLEEMPPAKTPPEKQETP